VYLFSLVRSQLKTKQIFYRNSKADAIRFSFICSNNYNVHYTFSNTCIVWTESFNVLKKSGIGTNFAFTSRTSASTLPLNVEAQTKINEIISFTTEK
jgi:L-cystine uptake protein TcyP (sodium:dicarboxylate symporter family)